MITIVHTHPKQTHVWAVNKYGEVYKPLGARYFSGKSAPNYPLPAIPVAVTLDYEFTAIWHVGVGLLYYRDEYETVFCY